MNECGRVIVNECGDQASESLLFVPLVRRSVMKKWKCHCVVI